jgi:hypothetical protein
MVGIWQYRRRAAVIGAAACGVMILCSASSGPVVSAAAGVAALLMWQARKWMRAVRWAGVAMYVALEAIMKAPAYYLIARIDITGGSTGWHRARLIESSMEHLGEWWLGGTDYTRHWMPTGVSWNPNHTDITNHYLHMGVLGGLPLMLLFIAVLAKAFSYVGGAFHGASDVDGREQWMRWGLGAALFAHAVTCISVSYFDQSVVFLFVTLAAVGSAHLRAAEVRSTVPSGLAGWNPAFRPRRPVHAALSRDEAVSVGVQAARMAGR